MKTCMLVLMMFAVAGCGGRDDAPAQPQATSAAPTAAASDDAVAAVLKGTGKPIARLAFVLGARPQVGTATAVRLDLTAAEPVTAVQIAVQAEEATVEPAQASLSLSEANVTVSQQLTYTPQRAGLGEITVRLRSAEPDSPESVYVIPVMVAAAP